MMSDGNEFAELLWENGQAVVHGWRKNSQTAFPPFTSGGASSSRVQEKHPASDPVALLKTGGIFGAAGSLAPSVHDFTSGLDATRDNGDLDDTVPWIHYPIIDEDTAAPALAESYSPDFFSELHAAAAAAATNISSLPPPPPIQHTGSNRSNPVAGSSREPESSKESHRIPVPAARPEPEAEFARQPRAGGGEGLMNFSLFSRPAAMARASLQSAQRLPQTGTDKASNVTSSTRVESTVVQTASGPRTTPVLTDQRTAWPQPKEVRFSCAPVQTPGNLQQEVPRDRLGNSLALHKKVETRKAPEAAVATSSVCSGNGAGIGDDEPWRQQKRKMSQPECSASQDDDLEDESGGMRRSGSRGTKRSRTAEVHNLSERRRRDRINEKMRALQELIPNCNKIDKASMLDEAIEYLKTLQLQVQMMSMGSGLCIPPMLLPPVMQHLQIPPIAHFPHLSMGLGYGMGVFDINSAAAVPLQPMPGAHFPCPMIPGATPQGLGIPGRNTMPMFGVPGQTIHPSASSVQPYPSLAGHPVRPNMAPPVPITMANMVQEQQQGVASQQQQSLNNEARQGANTGDPQLHTILQAENQHFSVPSSAQTESGQFLDSGSNRTDTTGRNEAET